MKHRDFDIIVVGGGHAGAEAAHAAARLRRHAQCQSWRIGDDHRLHPHTIILRDQQAQRAVPGPNNLSTPTTRQVERILQPSTQSDRQVAHLGK